MITHIWQVKCDYCGKLLGETDGIAPRPKDCKKIALVKGRHVFCDDKCATEYDRDLSVRFEGHKPFEKEK